MENTMFLWGSDQDISRIIELLKKDEIIVGTSDTVLGLLAPLNRKGFDTLNAIKGRSEKPYIVLIGNCHKMSLFVQKPISKSIQLMVEHCWPGPLTLIMKAKNDLAPFLRSKDGTIALRVPDHSGLLVVLEHFDGLFSTSANKTSMSVPNLVSKLDPEVIEKSAALVLDRAGQETIAPIKPSTILDCTGEVIQVVREGSYPIDELEKIALQKFKRS